MDQNNQQDQQNLDATQNDDNQDPSEAQVEDVLASEFAVEEPSEGDDSEGDDSDLEEGDDDLDIC